MRFAAAGIGILVATNVFIWQAVFPLEERELRISFLDVGQGDSIFIEGPTGLQMLVDGGPDRGVLRRLAQVISPLDRTIDLLVATHPDKDHIAGLTDVFDRYDVSYFIESGVKGDTSFAAALGAAASSEPNLVRVVAHRGQRIQLGGGAYADILFPDRDVFGVETNTGSIIMRIVYGDTSFLLTGDSPIAIEDWLTTLDPSSLDADILKAGHHGSRTSTSREFLSAVSPNAVVISAGKDNSYSHPHKEVMQHIAAAHAAAMSTADEGTITFVSDGRSVLLK